MKLQKASPAYTPRDQQELRNEIEARDALNLKKNQHAELVSGAYWVLTSPNGTRYYLTVDNSGVLAATPA